MPRSHFAPICHTPILPVCHRIRYFQLTPDPILLQLNGCIGALGLHLASRFDASYRAWRAMRGEGSLREARRPPVVSERCRWISEQSPTLEIPEFPAFTEQFTLPETVPIPR